MIKHLHTFAGQIVHIMFALYLQHLGKPFLFRKEQRAAYSSYRVNIT